MVKQVLTIAGSDSTGGAGLEADLKTFQEFGLYGYAVITSIVTMDASKGWQHEVHELDSEFDSKTICECYMWRPNRSLENWHVRQRRKRSNDKHVTQNK